MTPEQWQEIEKKLSHPWGIPVRLRVDGYDLTLAVRARKPLRFVICPFVNGYFRGEWLVHNQAGEWCEEARRFLPLKKRHLFSPARIKRLGKKLGKKLDKTYEHREPFFTAFAALKRHLIANNESIELVPETQEAKA